jgi:hypothetical protein
MLDCSTDDAVRLLDELVDANLADRYRGRFDRYSGGFDIPSEPEFYAYVTHDLLRDYAYLKATELPEEYQQAMNRLLDCYRRRTLHPHLTPAWVQVEAGVPAGCASDAHVTELRFGDGSRYRRRTGRQGLVHGRRDRLLDGVGPVLHDG